MPDPHTILADLTDPQRQAVTHRDGPLLVLAGPGSGKTRVITRRAAYLTATGVPPRNVLAITFTNKAADEMAHRIAALGVGDDMIVCTFHSLCARLLRQYADRAGVSPSFSIFDQSDRVSAIREAIERAQVSEANFAPARVESRISRLKNDMIDAAQAIADAQSFETRAIARIYEAYEQVLTEQNALDFDDLLLRVARLLRDDAELRDRLEDRFRYVLVDEYQDTNHAQYLIARGLALSRRNLCATGDPDQSIYGWRGANLGNILDFEEDFPEATVVRLEQNYRSTRHILAAADGVIRRNRDRKPKSLWTANAEGEPVRVVECDDAAAEAEWIADRIAEHVRKGGAYNDAAILYRINALTRVLEDALRRATIPYRIIRGVEFYSRREIKDVLAYLRVLINPNDEVSLLRIINTPARGIGKTTVDRLRAHARAAGASMMHAVLEPQAVGDVQAATVRKIKAFTRLLDSLRPLVHAGAQDALQQVLEQTGLAAAYDEEATDDARPRENLDELVSAAAEYDRTHPAGSLVEWLHQISLVSDQDAYDAAAGAVTMMTLHAAKGLEFDAVFIAGCDEGLLPHPRHADTHGGLEEERRLLFVGMTRARAALTLTYVRYRDVRGVTQRTGPSMFLAEMPDGATERIRLGTATAPAGDEDDHPRDPRYAGWRPGQLVMHPSYGAGRLLWIEPRRGQTRAGVRFAAYGEKTLILEYTKLERVDPTDLDF